MESESEPYHTQDDLSLLNVFFYFPVYHFHFRSISVSVEGVFLQISYFCTSCKR